MAAKRRTTGENPKTPPVTRSESSALETFLSGPRAKWLFFGIYFLFIVILFSGFLFSDGMLYGNDTIPDGIYTRQFYRDFHAAHGGIPRWNPLILGGLPFIDAMHGDTFYPGAWIQFFLPLHRALGHKLVWHVFLAGVFMYLFLRTLRIRREAAFLGGLMYMLAPSFVSLVFPAHDAKIYVTAFLPLAFALLEMLMESPRVWKAAALGASMGLLILTSHVQMAYYSYWALGLWFLFRLWTSRADGPVRTGKRAALFAGAVVLALGVGLVQLLPSYRFTTTQSVRSGVERTGYTYATSWSMHPEEAAGMIVPSFPGFQKEQKSLYWGRNPFKLNSEYNGILPILFAVLALAMYRTSRTWFFLGLGALALVYALGADTPVYRLFYAFVPGVKNFRAPGMIIFLFAFAAVAMSALFLSWCMDRPREAGLKTARTFMWAAGGVLAAAVIVTVAAGPLFDLWKYILYNTIIEDRYKNLIANIPFFTRDLWRVAILAASALAGLSLFLSKKIGVPALTLLLAIAAAVDASVVDNRYIMTIDPATYPEVAPDRSVFELRERLKADPNARILDTVVALSKVHVRNYYAMFGITSADGAHNNELQSYEAFRGRNGLNFLRGWIDFEKGGIDPTAVHRNNFLRVAGVKYVLLPSGDGAVEIVENPGSLGRAYVVHGCAVAPDDSSAAAMLGDAAFDPAATVILDGRPDPEPVRPADTGAVSRVESLTYGSRDITVTADLAAPGIIVLSENRVPYWHAAVDGREARIFRAYGTFMAVAAPAGRHTVVFTFRSGPYETGKRVTLSALGIIVLALGVSGALAFVRRGKAA